MPATVFQKLLFLSYVKLYLLFPFSVLLEFFCCSLPTINTISMFYSFSARLLLDACLRCGRDEPSLQAEWHKSLSFIAKKVFLFLHSLRQPFTLILIMLLQGPKLWIWSVSNSSMITWNMQIEPYSVCTVELLCTFFLSILYLVFTVQGENHKGVIFLNLFTVLTINSTVYN